MSSQYIYKSMIIRVIRNAEKAIMLILITKILSLAAKYSFLKSLSFSASFFIDISITTNISFN